jgi:predicted amidohydrolase
VRIGAQARALKNQCFVLQSPTVGDAPWSPAVDVTAGRRVCMARPTPNPRPGRTCPPMAFWPWGARVRPCGFTHPSI